MASLRVVQPGLLTTVQDCGRWGWQALGVPVAGPMDVWSFRLANWLVGNDSGAAGLEATVVGPTIRFDDAAVVAVTGGRFDLRCEGRPIPMDEAVAIRAGADLSFGAAREGARGYLAVAGGLDVTPVFGSRATHLPSRCGGVEGRALRGGDVLAVLAARGRPRALRARARRPLPREGARLRVLAGPQDDLFTDEARAVFTRSRYTITPASNRMGYRLNGPALSHRGSADIISDATTFGTIQVPKDGQPILLMADRQTSGGYPKIATVIAADLGLAAQLGPGAWIEFAWCDMKTALAALIELEQVFL